MIKVAFTAFFVTVIVVLGTIARKLAIVMSPKGLMHRQHFKYQKYQKLVGGMKKKITKIDSCIPLKTVFRSFNPDEMHHEKLVKRLDGIDAIQLQNNNIQMV